jgi:hypothetical protein
LKFIVEEKRSAISRVDPNRLPPMADGVEKGFAIFGEQ